jgi:tetratricopeptide (TPR) repeat protein
MKKIVLATVMALACAGLFVTPALQAQGDQGTIQIKDPAEFNAYQMATTQSDPKAKAAALESFLTTYPQSVVKNAVLDMLIDTYQQTGDADKAMGAAQRLLQIDPNNMKAIVISVYLKKQACAKSIDPKSGKSSDQQTCDDAQTLAKQGLAATKPASVSADDWKKQTDTANPIFHSAMALDDYSKGDYKGEIDEYKAELNLYTPDQSKSVGLVDSLQLADAYTKQEQVDAQAERTAESKAKAVDADPTSTPDAKAAADAAAKAAKDLAGSDYVDAVWFYGRVWDFAPPQYKAQIEPKLEYYYKKYHGSLDGLDAVKQQAQATTFPPDTLHIDPAKSAAEQIHDLIASTPDLNTLALADKETVLALGSKDDADKLWALLKDKDTQVPGDIISVSPAGDEIDMAVTQDAKDSKLADFIVNLKTPMTDAEKKIYVAGFEFKTQPAAELDGTYDKYTQIPATDTAAQRAAVVLRDGVILGEKKKTVPVHKPAAAHHAPAAH